MFAYLLNLATLICINQADLVAMLASIPAPPQATSAKHDACLTPPCRCVSAAEPHGRPR